MDGLSLKEQLAKVQAIMKDEAAVEEPVIAIVPSTWSTQPSPGVGLFVTCNKCNEFNHFARDCMQRCKTACIHCYWCNMIGHLVKDCLGNENRDKTLVPINSPDKV